MFKSTRTNEEVVVPRNVYNHFDVPVTYAKPRSVHSDDLFDVAYGLLVNSTNGMVGETFVFKNKKTGRIINPSFLLTRDEIVLVQDSSRTRGIDVARVLVSPHSNFTEQDEAAVMAELWTKSPAYKRGTTRQEASTTAEEEFTWGTDIELPQGEMVDGRYMLDGMFVFSYQAADYVSQIYSMTLEEFVGINVWLLKVAWENSNIDNAAVRVVSVQLWDWDSPVNVEAVGWLSGIGTETFLDPYGIDWFAVWTAGTAPGATSAEALTNIEGSFQLMIIDRLINFRHEIGHSAGINHCWDESDVPGYKYGWQLNPDDETSPGTIMCGNGISIFSNPDIEIDGFPAGDVEKANAAKQWRDAVTIWSGQRKHIVPYDSEVPTDVEEGEVSSDPLTSQTVEFTVEADTKKIIFKTNAQDLVDERGHHSVFLNSDCCPGVYYGNKWQGTAHYLHIPCPAEGTWLAYVTGSTPINYTIETYM
eukprot:Blabericola_migrator_1__6487@NODE_3275_length_1890_cov_1790_665935_g2049_i0_p1_GENE_NODE_3275_length_1890_cov_1790_665935_g2049_i0NODE_3275_length_1890_cov_1790_665935_g2049_i0_p1_ORF_typecomplete_len475_score107_21Reprolysin_4/PF13583_6/0_00041Peptidase_M66/PF10462_9/0_028Peptidase_M10/PF00413_24/0_15Peptidase_M10/PF00413_24/3_6e03Reprolysin_5/PF13688_6/0_13Reprolysin_5/PF13688_6/5_5e03Peptidase_M54/PF07998_11/0_15_NODE_3275_length_1890_cov_1790_665935_g2049_i02591683